MAIIICLVICVIVGLALLFYLRWENRRRDKKSVGAVATGNEEKYGGATQRELMDTTDLKNVEFRYVY
jgi:uncharacterized iron-regulated membrane protein